MPPEQTIFVILLTPLFDLIVNNRITSYNVCYTKLLRSKFLKKVSPKYAVISVGTENDYGHPHSEALARLKKVDCHILRTDLQGTIVVASDGKNITVENNKTEMTDTKISQPKYILNTSSKKIHYPECSAVEKISAKNYAETDDYEKALSDGYTPCVV